MTERWTDERLDRFATMVEKSIVSSDKRLNRMEDNLTRVEDNLTRMEAQLSQSKRDSDARMTRLEQQLAQQNTIANQRAERLEQLMTTVIESNVELKENTAQLKKAVDYLLSKDGG